MSVVDGDEDAARPCLVEIMTDICEASAIVRLLMKSPSESDSGTNRGFVVMGHASSSTDADLVEAENPACSDMDGAGGDASKGSRRKPAMMRMTRAHALLELWRNTARPQQSFVF